MHKFNGYKRGPPKAGCIIFKVLSELVTNSNLIYCKYFFLALITATVSKLLTVYKLLSTFRNRYIIAELIALIFIL